MKTVCIGIHLIQIRNTHIALNLIITFDNTNIDLVEKRFLLL